MWNNKPPVHSALKPNKDYEDHLDEAAPEKKGKSTNFRMLTFNFLELTEIKIGHW